jgi:predicted DNA-binding transcriptional regulator
MTTRDGKPILPNCDVLPPMDEGRRRRRSTNGTPGKAKGKPNRRRAANRFAVLNAFVDFTLRDLRRTEIAVWLILYRDTRNGTARTSQADLARRAGISERTARRAVERLRRLGLLKVVYRGGIGRGVSAYVVRSVPQE